MQTITARCRDSFGSQIRQRGAAYFDEGRIELDFVDEGEGSVIATVYGTSEYDVSIEWDRAGRLTVACSCPYARVSLCKHIWGTMLAMDEAGLGEGLERFAVLHPHLVEYDPYDWPGEVSEPPPRPEPWRQWLMTIEAWTSSPTREPAKRQREIFVATDPEDSGEEGVRLSFKVREMRKDGRFGKIKTLRIDPSDLSKFSDAEQRLLQPLVDLGRTPRDTPNWWYGRRDRMSDVVVPYSLLGAVLPPLCASGRFGWWLGADPEPAFRPLRWDPGTPYRVVMSASEDEGGLRLEALLERDSEGEGESHSFAITDCILFVKGGLAFLADRIVRFDVANEAFSWLVSLFREQVTIPAPAVDEALAALLPMPGLPAIRLPESVAWSTELGTPVPILILTGLDGDGEIRATVSFAYGEEEVRSGESRGQVADPETRTVVRRDVERERELVRSLSRSEPAPIVLDAPQGGEREYLLRPDAFVGTIETLIEAGWRIRSEGRAVRRSGTFEISVRSGVDWFDVAGAMDFDGQEVPLPRLLAAARTNSRYVVLGDGSVGMLPENWLERFAGFAGIAAGPSQPGGDTVRFAAHQALVLDALLAAEPAVDADEVFASVRDKLRTFDRLRPQPTPDDFQGELRAYQEIGLAWLELLADLRLGGCLADDMGLGKTVQVLAHLWRRKQQGLGDGLPSLLVVPRSLIYNWTAEAERFTPGLTVTSYHGPQRKRLRHRLGDYDLVVTTYGTLRRDIGFLREQEFAVAVLDEAQAIKNPKSQTAKASRLVHARHRLALTGTPVENHLGELWSIFEFLNPALLGQLPSLAEHVGKNRLPPEALATVARALKPLILRRTKEEVLPDLPPKTEQTLYCDLSPKERREYDKLRNYYRAKLLSKVKTAGLGRAKILVLEALLRLRQVACHPALLDPERHKEDSAKLEVLVEQVEQIAGEGHKVLVFSQFTKLLGLVKSRFDQRSITYEYLDGRTRDRQAKVEKFQTDPDCTVFLISLKAGGLGLNLTAAGYVFLLDPWWNPAVESQAIDRAHRIGQEKPVFAYRLIARGTIEEKILKLQEEKRALADAVVARDGRLLKQLTVQDLELLLG